MYTVKQGKSNVVKFYLKKGADLHATDNNGRTALHYVINKDKMWPIKKLIKLESNLVTKDLKDITVLMYAVLLNC